MSNKNIIPLEETSFKDSQAYAFAQSIRRAIRNSPSEKLSIREGLILIKIVNLWFHHRNTRKKYIHPGRNLLARNAKCSVATVKRALKKFRDLKLITAVGYLNGRQKMATRYVVDLQSIYEYASGQKVPDTLLGELVQISDYKRQNDTPNYPSVAGQNDPLLYTMLRPVKNGLDTPNGDQS